MSGAKIKNLIILILAITTAMLLALVIPMRRSQLRGEQEQHEKIAQLYASYDVQLDSAVLPAGATLYTIELASGAQESAAQALLGAQAVRQPDATRYAATYTSELGRCEFSRAGGFFAALSDQKSVNDLQKHAKKLLREMGCETFSVTQAAKTAAGTYELTATQSLLGVPVFDAALTLRYVNGALTQMSGTLFPGAGTITRVSEAACISCADAMLLLLSSRDRLGWVGSRIDQVQQGYVYTETAAGALRFVPGWRIDTDTGAFFVNGATREVRALA